MVTREDCAAQLSLMWASETVPRTVATELNLIGMYHRVSVGSSSWGSAVGTAVVRQKRWSQVDFLFK